MTTLTDYIHQIVPLVQDEKARIENAFVTKKMKKGDLWIQEGKICNKVAYLTSGKLRIFYFDETGNEITCYFVTSGSFFSSFTSFLTRTPTHENIEAMEESIIQEIDNTDLELLSDEIPKVHIWRRIVAENLFITMEKRIEMLQSQTAHERYDKMLKENPDLILSVPLQYTASFLGITPQHLSRLRKETMS
jgi:CRP-like cAMP-binding protein